MSNTVCDRELCCGCAACEAICPKNAITIKDEIQYTESVINDAQCIGCNLCKKVCPSCSEPVFMEPMQWYQGWSEDSALRKKSSSGGLAQSISRQFVENGGYVCSCLFEGGDFVYKLTHLLEDIEKFRGSKYVKSNPKDCYKSILNILKENDNKVLFIGLPCHAAAVKNYVGSKYDKNLYTIDLICHGTPSVKLLEKFLAEHDIDIKEINEIRFRHKGMIEVPEEHLIEAPGVMDEYSIAFLDSICYTSNCYQCKFAKSKRISDITLGDSWGSELSEEAGKGISLILCQTDKGKRLLDACNLELHPVDIMRAIEFNNQLREPSARPLFLDRLFSDIKDGKTVRAVVFKYCRKKYIKWRIKKILYKLRIKRPGTGGRTISVRK
ncbi:MAG: coenzyme F420-reducing hydrogenase [Lachnospiraceae bacterium]|nr:coenzyme F420-reducing hydrogenase [Lachnospiraceae bacterium]